ncbi:MAG: nickel pincer cofactor biosynthesis protein LarC [Thermoanaerobaculales bacterium]|nr:nickel pincer cofactor biosynthesis protein LarC [Thermoanaerobaculales bacterium]
MSRRALWLDCSGGAAGDMVLCALVEAAGCPALVEELPARLGFADVAVAWPAGRAGGFAARRLEVLFDPDAHPHHRTLADVTAIVDRAGLPAPVAAMARAVFTTLAEAEAEVHGETVEAVHFHEVGAVDAIVDVVGACLALDELAVDEVVCSPLPIGSGVVDSAHGVLPLPAPAVAAMLAGVPVRPAGIEGETVTPTGAALVTTIAHRFGALPAMTVEAVGIGAGRLERPGLPSLLRAFVGELAEPAEIAETDHVVVETSLDDLDPRVLPVVLERLLGSGALDASITPVVMKKGRPGHLVSALAPTAALDAVVGVLLTETTSLGCRSYPVTKHHLGRRMATVGTPWGPVAVKLALAGDRVLRRVPEFEDCAARAREAGVPVRDVLAAAAAAAEVDDGEL